MNRFKNIVSVTGGVLLLLSYLTINLTENYQVIFISNLVSNLWIEILLLILILYISSDSVNKRITIILRRQYLLFSLLNIKPKFIITIMMTILFMFTIYNFYFLARAKVFFYQNSLLSVSEMKSEQLITGIEYERNNELNLAKKYYERFIELTQYESDPNIYFLSEKIITFSNRLKYGRIYFSLAKREYNQHSQEISQNGLSLAILAYKTMPDDKIVKEFTIRSCKKTIERIDRVFHSDWTKEELIGSGKLDFILLLGEFMKRELQTGDYGARIALTEEILNDFISGCNLQLLEDYVKASWRYDDCVHLINNVDL